MRVASQWELRENNALELANQIVRYYPGTFFSKTLDPLVTKSGSNQVNNTNFGLL